jgi:CRISPR/Cas system-associated exonuclease Cas4 (RecB family)
LERIPVSWLHSHAYCEYQIYLQHVKGVQPEITLEVQKGIEAHASLDEAHKAAAELELPIGEALTKAKVEGIVLSSREVYVEGERLIGCIDEVVFMPDRILIIDDKPGDVAWPSSRIQTLGYCLAFEQQYKPELPITAVLRNRDTGENIWAQTFGEEQREEVVKAVDRIQRVLSQETKAVSTENPNKCRACRFKRSCDVRSG